MLLFLDAETYYDTEYSLTRMAPPNYILDPRFEMIMLAVAEGDKPSYIVNGPDVGKFFQSVNPATTTCVTFNALFDMCIFSWRYNWVPALMLDAMGMARALRGHVLKEGASLRAVSEHLGVGHKGHEIENVRGMRRADIIASDRWHRFCQYAVQDVELTRKIFDCLLPEFPSSERRLMDRVLRCAVEPAFWCDASMLEAHLTELAEQKLLALAQVALITNGAQRADLMSTTKFAELLTNMGVRVQQKISPAGKVIPALAKTDEFMSGLLEHEDPRIQAVAAARLGEKSTIEETRGRRLLSIAGLDWSSYRPGNFLPIPLAYGRTHTHRLAGDWKINMQNLPSARATDENGIAKSKLRKALIAPPGHVVLVGDSSQIEARMNAWFCGQQDVLDQFAAKKDLYSILAHAVFGYPVAKTSIERFIGKSGVLGLGFRCGASKFYAMVLRSARLLLKPAEFAAFTQVWSEALAQKTVDTYRGTNKEIVAMWSKLDYAIRGSWVGQEPPTVMGPVTIGHGVVTLPNGMKMSYADPRYDADQSEYLYTYGRFNHKMHGGPLLENIVQALARIVTMNAALRLWDLGLKFKLQSHDELGFIVPEKDADAAKALLLTELRRRPSWAPGLPLDAEANYGPSYGDAK